MTPRELQDLYDREFCAGPPTQVPETLYEDMADLLDTLKAERDRIAREDPESVLAEGAGAAYRRVRDLSMRLVELRIHKIAELAVKGGAGRMTPGERVYHRTVSEITRAHVRRILGVHADDRGDPLGDDRRAPRVPGGVQDQG